MKNIDKKKIIIIGSIVAILISCIILILLKNNSSSKSSSKSSLEDLLITLGSDFYENHYYPGIQNKELLNDYKESGVNIDINSLNVIIPLPEETKKILNKNKCDYQNTKLIIYPNTPFGSTDYKIKVELSCEK